MQKVWTYLTNKKKDTLAAEDPKQLLRGPTKGPTSYICNNWFISVTQNACTIHPPPPKSHVVRVLHIVRALQLDAVWLARMRLLPLATRAVAQVLIAKQIQSQILSPATCLLGKWRDARARPDTSRHKSTKQRIHNLRYGQITVCRINQFPNPIFPTRHLRFRQVAGRARATRRKSTQHIIHNFTLWLI